MALRKFTVEQMIEAVKRAHGLKSVVAQSLGCNRMTVERYAKDFPTVQQAFEDEREWIVDLAEGKMLQAINAGEAWATALVLRTLGRKRGYVEKHETEVSGPGGGPIPIREIVVSLPALQAPSDADDTPDTA